MKNEIQELSNDLNVITSGINAYKRIAGEAIFEIGKRLKHVKEDDLVYGEWLKWCESIGMDRSNANKFIRIYDELGESDVVTSPHLGMDALYMIAQIPEEERTKQHEIPSSGKQKSVDEMTVKELREVKKALKESEKQREYEALLRKEAEEGKQKAESDYNSVVESFQNERNSTNRK